MEKKNAVPVSTDQKNIIKAFVYQVKELELERLKLKQLNEKLLLIKNDEINSNIQKMTETINKAQQDLDKKRTDYQESVKKKQQGKPRFDIFSFAFLAIIKAALGCLIGFIGGWLLHGIVFLVASCIAYLATDGQNGYPEMIISLLPMIKWVTMPIGGVVGILWEIKGSIELFRFSKKEYGDIDLTIKSKERHVEEANRH